MAIITKKYHKILIVSDDAKFKNSLASPFRLQNFLIDLATGGFHLLSIMEERNDYSLIILYEDMSDMPAGEVISLLRLTKSQKDLPIIYVSKKNDESEIWDLLASGANEYIVHTGNFGPIIDKAKKILHSA